ncbi:uncharacterized protein LOC142325765 [Lycorma delicatula]|uniref:uncharacterized protein LOC142325765 n=1 Tax=Lycorma delicatula TaxID=130591 RepID=UPI003F50E6C6
MSYDEFLNEYLENDEMGPVTEDREPETTYYLPHHPIIKESSSTTRLRVVFDASAKTSNNNSLNDVLMTGPTIQRDLQAILLSFRTHSYVFTADIKQMYRKILIDKSQRDFQRIVWRNDLTDKIDTYRLKTVTYGTASAPFLAIRCLFQLAEEGKNLCPKASKSIR